MSAIRARRGCAAAAATALLVTLGLPAQAATAADSREDDPGLAKALIKESWNPPWFGPLATYAAAVDAKGAKPHVCVAPGDGTRDRVLKGMKASALAFMTMTFGQKPGHALALQQQIYEYTNEASGAAAWEDMKRVAASCPRSWSDTFEPPKVIDGARVRQMRVRVTVTFGAGSDGREQMVVTTTRKWRAQAEDGAWTRQMAQVLNIWTREGAALVHIDAYKAIPSQKRHALSPAQRDTLQTMTSLAIERYRQH
jgi:hypothetical protein